ncbi:MAG: RDD family protein [Actinomycetes bacterium]
MSATRVDDHPTWYAPPPPVPPLPPGVRPSGLFRRINATIVDTVLVVLLSTVVTAPSLLLASEEIVPAVVPVVVFYAAYLGWYVVLQVQQGRTGGTVGKHLLGLRVVREATGEPIGVGSSLARPFVHLIDQLPCYAGFFAPIFDSRRRTFTDMAMGTVVIRAPRARLGIGTAVVATTLAGVLSFGAMAVLALSAPLSEALDASAAAEPVEAARPTALVPVSPPTTPPGGALPVDDLDGRIMPPLKGFREATVDWTGEFTVDQLAGESAESPQEVAEEAAILRSWGLQGGFRRTFDAPGIGYTVLVHRSESQALAAEYLRDGFTETETADIGMPDVVAFPPVESGTEQWALFAHGPYVFEVGVFTTGEPVEPRDLRAVIEAQRSYARAVG